MKYRKLKDEKDNLRKQICGLRSALIINELPSSRREEYNKALKRKEFQYKILSRIK